MTREKQLEAHDAIESGACQVSGVQSTLNDVNEADM